jgi:V-type H+-transporting ATPase subunit a
MFRSASMGYYNIIMPRESAWEIMNKLGDLKCVHFLDMNPAEAAFNRPFSNSIRRCDDIETRLSFLESEMRKFDIPIIKCGDVAVYQKALNGFLASRGKNEKSYFQEIESDITERAQFFTDQLKSYHSLVEKNNELLEFRQVLEKTRDIIVGLRASDGGSVAIDYGTPVEGINSSVRLAFIAGTIHKEDALRFKRIVFRVTRGNTWTTLHDIELAGNNQIIDTGTEKPALKTVFLIVYQGGSDVFKSKLQKICDSFGATRFDIPELGEAFMAKEGEINRQLIDVKNLLAITKVQVRGTLQQFSVPHYPGDETSHLEELRLYVAREKSIYYALNMLRLENTYYQAFCWIPDESLDQVREVLTTLIKDQSHMAASQILAAPHPPGAQVPTYIRTNDFTFAAQEIVNTYGIPRYKEVNPGLFTVASFPFLFGVMFGDIAHGSILTAFALYLILFENKLRAEKSSLVMVLKVRYFFLLLGICGIYCGFMYNDFVSFPLNLFGSCYIDDPKNPGQKMQKPGCVYPFGMDPVWQHASNELNFVNSFKMKFAVIIGVIQMIFGVFLRLANNIHFRSCVDFVFDFVPQIIFLVASFGFMILLIFIKWAQTYTNPPSIINTLIQIFFHGGEVIDPVWGDGSQQQQIQQILLICIAISVPWMLLFKPFIINSQNKKMLQKARESLGHASDAGQPLLSGGHDNTHEAHGLHVHTLQDLFVDTAIETIEYCLGVISHTASYLRLWALSLAHAQLAQVSCL